MALCQNRLQEERKQWRRDHPFAFYAKPARTKEGVLDLKNWECGIPGKEKTIWEGGLFKLTMAFPEGKCRARTSAVKSHPDHADCEFSTRVPYETAKV
jgi:hypothetical protein